jgi:predicted DCC family thiol-disulfide oxidoreductase YuxK
VNDPTRTPEGLAGIDYPILLFDGTCGFCDASIRWVVERDGREVLHFAPQESIMGRFLLEEQGLGEVSPDSLVLIEEGRASLRSTASLRIVAHLDRPWSWLRHLLWIPEGLRDLVYDLVAKNRYRLAGRLDTCMRPDPCWAHRFHH